MRRTLDFCCAIVNFYFMDVKTAHTEIQNKTALLIDIREEDELKESGIAEGALWMSSIKICENHPDWIELKKTLPKDRPIYMYCRSGGRVGRVAAFLSSEGYRIENLGGLKDWQAAGLPVKSFAG
jgi:rhodanese-related sulfurtransferase